MNVASLFLETALRYPELTAIIDKDRSISFGEMRDEVLKTSTYFLEKGIKPGDRILVFMPMGIDLYRVVLALFNIGATAVFLDEWVTKSRMEMCCEIAQCTGFIGTLKARLIRIFSKELRAIPIHLKIKGRSESRQFTQVVDFSMPALITFTTGTTGRPKAANRTHGFLMEQFEALKDEIDPQPFEVDMPILPIVLFMNLGIGCTSIITEFKASKPEEMNSAKIISQIQKYGVKRLISSPYFINRLADYILENSLEVPSLKSIFTGGAPVFPKMASNLRKAFPFANITIVYGSTEVEPISSISADDLLNSDLYRDSGSIVHHECIPDHIFNQGLPVGTLYLKTQIKIIRIIDEPLPPVSEKELEALQVKEGEIGEIVVTGPHVLKSYFNSEEAFRKTKILTETAIWHRTGDSGKLINGELYLFGRCVNLIHRNNKILSPFVIEEQLGEIEGITMGTLIEKSGKLILVVESSHSLSVIKDKVKFIPFDDILILEKIPRDPRHHSRIDYAKLLIHN